MRATDKNSDVLTGCAFGFCLTKHASWNDLRLRLSNRDISGIVEVQCVRSSIWRMPCGMIVISLDRTHVLAAVSGVSRVGYDASRLASLVHLV